MAMASMTALDTALKIQKFETECALQSIANEVFDTSSEEMIVTDSTPAALPESITVKVSATAGTDSTNSVKIPLIQALSNAPTEGTTTIVGSEESLIFRSFVMNYNNVKHAVITERYGITANDMAAYLNGGRDKVLSKQLGTYFKQVHGKYKRQALLEVYSNNLTAAPVSKTLHWHPNWYFPNVANASQPVYDTTKATMTEALGDAFNSAGTTVAAAGDVVYIQKLQEYAETYKFINKLKLADGGEGYVYLMPSPQVRRLKSPATVNGFTSLGNVFTDGAGMPNEMKLQFPGLVGKIGNIVIVEDPRYPTITTGGTNGSWTVTPAYAPIGNAADGRDKATTAFMVGYLLGAGALYEWNAEPMHWEYNYEDYDQKVGAGLFEGIGYQAPLFEKTSVSDDAMNFGSIVCPVSNPA